MVFWKSLVAWALMAVCVALHAIGLTAIFHQTIHSRRLGSDRFWPITRLLIQVAGMIIILHLAEISVWALFYLAAQLVPDAETAFYFSLVTYTTVGYGDIVLPQGRRWSAGIEALTGILLSGWSAAFFFALASRIFPLRLGPGLIHSQGHHEPREKNE